MLQWRWAAHWTREALWLHGELQPGIPWGTWGSIADGMPIVTKAGGFGDDSTFVKVIAAWKTAI